MDPRTARLLSLATYVIAWATLAYSAACIWEAVAPFKGMTYKVPASLETFCQLAVGSGLVVLGIPTISNLFKKERPKK